MTAVTARTPAQMVAEAHEILREVREADWPDSRHAQAAIGYAYGRAWECRVICGRLVNGDMEPYEVHAPGTEWWDDPSECALEWAADEYLEAAKAARNRLNEWTRKAREAAARGTEGSEAA
jgi:hypothetical protein